MKVWAWVLVIACISCLMLGCGKKGEGEGAKAKQGEPSTEIASPAVGSPVAKSKADANARSAGRMAKMAEEMYYATHSRYTSNLSDLEPLYQGITEDRGVTFIWGSADENTFRLTVTHKDGTGKTFVFHE